MDEGKNAGRLLPMNNASFLSKGIHPVSTVCQPVMEADTPRARLAQHCTFRVKRAYATNCGLSVLPLLVLRQSDFVSKRRWELSAISQLLARPKAVWPGHWPPLLSEMLCLAADDGLPSDWHSRARPRRRSEGRTPTHGVHGSASKLGPKQWAWAS